MRKFTALLMLLILLWPIPVRAEHTREEVRRAYRAVSDWSESSPYAREPKVTAPYDEGLLDQACEEDALSFLNFARWLCGLDPVRQSGIYDYQCQHGAVLLAVLDYVDHNAPRPADMDRNFYDSAHLATTSGNIVKFNWMRSSILREGVEYFLRDDGESNLAALGHRRWALNPLMGSTGFGLANSRSGMSYVLMYAHDLGNPDAQWDTVLWPAAGAFPANLMHDHLAWSIVLNPELCDLSASHPMIELTEARSGLSFRFDPSEGTGDGWCAMNVEGYGAGPCLMFRPDFEGTGFTDYQQNQRWTVRVEGLRGMGALEYTVEMISLWEEPVVNVELDRTEATLAPGQTLQLTADVIPTYADDLSVTWTSGDANVATVSSDGLVTAVGAGSCEIIAASGDIEDICRVTVG